MRSSQVSVYILGRTPRAYGGELCFVLDVYVSVGMASHQPLCAHPSTRESLDVVLATRPVTGRAPQAA